MNYAMNSTEVFGSGIRLRKRPSFSGAQSALAAWKRNPPVFSAARRNEKRCINWNLAFGLGTAALVSAAGWAGIAMALARVVN